MTNKLFQYLLGNEPTHQINGCWWSIMTARINYFNSVEGTNFDAPSSLLEYLDQKDNQ